MYHLKIMLKLDLAFNNVKPNDWYFVLDWWTNSDCRIAMGQVAVAMGKNVHLLERGRAS